METIYYYKTISDTWHISNGMSLEAREANSFLHKIRKTRSVVRLYLDVPEHFEIIKKNFHSPEYWEGRSWQDEYEEEPLNGEEK